MRPRKHNAGLPRGVYWRHGAYYRVVKRVWYRLGSAPDTPLPTDRLRLERAQIRAYALTVLCRAKQNAKGRRQIEFALTERDLDDMLAAAKWRRSVTGTPFTLEVIAGKRPYAPSIDRIDSAKGYFPGNCRMVCVAANYAMNVWGEAVLRQMMRNGRRTRVLDMSNAMQEKAL